MIHQGFGRWAKRPEEVLVVCCYDRYGISTVIETVAAMQRCSRFSVTVLNLHEHRYGTGGLAIHPSLNLDAFDAIVIHNTASYDATNLRSLDEHLETKLRDYQGVKILLKQDENFRMREVARFIGDTVIDVVFSCLPADEIPKVYPPEEVGSARFKRMLTGYVTPSLRTLPSRAENRAVDIGYRGSIQPLSFGRLAYEKRKIGDDVGRLLADSGLVLDISSRWEDRYGGEAWLSFLSSCKATLGVESGASVFDRNGRLAEICRQAERELGPSRDDAAYADAFLKYLEPLEGWVHYNQISPRHFEAAATRTLQIMYPGRYSDLFIPGRHYFALNRDYSNLREAVDLVKNTQRRNEIVECAYEELVRNERFWIESFVSDIDDALDEILQGRGKRRARIAESGTSARNVLLICAHEPVIDPRIGWIAKYPPSDIVIHTLGVVANEQCASAEAHESTGAITFRYPKREVTDSLVVDWLRATGDGTASAGMAEILRMFHANSLDDVSLAELVGASPGSERLKDFRWYLRHFLGVAATVIEGARTIRGIDAIIATDLDTLAAALILKGMFNIPLVYDAHEYWPESDVRSAEFETQYWSQMEARLVQYVDRCQTVSASLAALMGEKYSKTFASVPNAEPLACVARVPAKEITPGACCAFLFQGNFAPRRGIDLLIEAWADTDPDAILLLRGPDGEYKDSMKRLALETGLLETRIFFPESVSEDRLVAEAAASDVGVIPYMPLGVNYQNCCPNKLSQYMAAGLPILANDTRFVRQIMTESESGIVTDFANRARLVEAVNRLTRDPALRARYGAAANRYFFERFNWEACSTSLYEELTAMTRGGAKSRLLAFAANSGGDNGGVKQYYRSIPSGDLESAVVSTNREHIGDNLETTDAVGAGAARGQHVPQSPISNATPLMYWTKILIAVRLQSSAAFFWRCFPAALRHRFSPIAHRIKGALAIPDTKAARGQHVPQSPKSDLSPLVNWTKTLIAVLFGSSTASVWRGFRTTFRHRFSSIAHRIKGALHSTAEK